MPTLHPTRVKAQLSHLQRVPVLTDLLIFWVFYSNHPGRLEVVLICIFLGTVTYGFFHVLIGLCLWRNNTFLDPFFYLDYVCF